MAVIKKIQPIGEILKAKGIITSPQIEEVLRIGERTNTRVGKVLVNLGYATEIDIAEALADQYRIPFVMLTSTILDPRLIKLVPEATARRDMAIPVLLEGDILKVAMVDPLDVFAVDELAKVTNYKISQIVTTGTEILKAINRYYGTGSSAGDALKNGGTIEGIKRGYSPPEEHIAGGTSKKRLTGYGVSLSIGILTVLVLLVLSALLKPDINPRTKSTVESRQIASERNKKGVYFYRTGESQSAVNEFNEAIRLNPGNSVLYNNLGLTYSALDKGHEAEESFKKALAINQDYPEVLNNYGSLMDKLGEPNRANELYKKAILINPKYPAPFLNLAISLERQNKFSEAVAYYEKFMELSNDGTLKNGIRNKISRLRSSGY